MSQIYNVLIDLSASGNKLRESIHKNGIFLKASDKQEESFYNMVMNLLNRTKEYVELNRGYKHVIELFEFYDKIKEFVPDEVTFDLDELKMILDKMYKEERKNDDGNFVAAADMIVLWTIRMMNEKMYRTLTGEKYDERFDGLFEEANRY